MKKHLCVCWVSLLAALLPACSSFSSVARPEVANDGRFPFQAYQRIAYVELHAPSDVEVAMNQLNKVNFLTQTGNEKYQPLQDSLEWVIYHGCPQFQGYALPMVQPKHKTLRFLSGREAKRLCRIMRFGTKGAHIIGGMGGKKHALLFIDEQEIISGSLFFGADYKVFEEYGWFVDVQRDPAKTGLLGLYGRRAKRFYRFVERL